MNIIAFLGYGSIKGRSRGSMKKLSSLFICLLALVFSSVSCGGGSTSLVPKVKMSTQQMVSHEGYSTVALVHYDTDNDDPDVSDVKPYCSAVWVGDKHILTAYHCVKAEQKEQQERQDQREQNAPECSLLGALLGVCDPNKPADHKTIWMKGLAVHYVQWAEAPNVHQEPTGWHLGTVVGWDESKDLALVEASGNAIPPHQHADVAAITPAIGETIHVCGHPRGFYWTFLEGTVAGYRGVLKHHDKDTGPYMQGQVPIYFGNSGGPAFNDYGELVGISDMLAGLPAEGLFVHVDNIRAFLQDQNFLPKPEVKKAEKVVGVAPHEEASPPPKKDDSSDSPEEKKPEEKKPEAPHQPTFHMPAPPFGTWPR